MSSSPAATSLPSASSDFSPQPTTSLRTRAIHSSVWTMIGYGSGQFIRLAGNMVMTRLLFPEMFGLMALVNIFLQGLGMFSDVGIGPAIIQNKRGDEPGFLNTAWTIQVFRGFALWICACIIAWPVAHFYDHRLLWVIPVAGASAAIAGFNSTALFTLNRHLNVARITILEWASKIGSLVVMIALALYFKNIWPLVAGSLVGSAVYLALSHRVLPGVRNRLHWDKTAAHALFRFGRWIFLSTVLTFLASQADRLIFGKLIPLSLLGVYSVALLMAMMPTQAVLKIGSSVVFAAYSRARVSPDKFPSIFARVRIPLLICGGWAVTCLIAAGPPLIDLLYDHRYEQAGVILQLLAISSWFQMLQVTSGSALLALDRAQWVASGNATKLVSMIVLIPLGLRFGGIYGAIGGIIGSDLLKYVALVIGLSRLGLQSFLKDLGLSALVAVGGLGGIAVMQYTDPTHQRSLPALLLALAVATIPWVPLALVARGRKATA